jgi:hypothetical protein
LDAPFFYRNVGFGGSGGEVGLQTAGIGSGKDEFPALVGEEGRDEFCANVAAGGCDEDVVGC